jgi:hypothetical protein
MTVAKLRKRVADFKSDNGDYYYRTGRSNSASQTFYVVWGDTEEKDAARKVFKYPTDGGTVLLCAPGPGQPMELRRVLSVVIVPHKPVGMVTLKL